MITTTGPWELSGFAAGVSVEGPIASVSLRLESTGRGEFGVAVVASVGSLLCWSGACCVGVVCASDEVIAGDSVVCAGAPVAAAGSVVVAAGNGAISTRVPCALVGRELDDGRAAEGASEGEAMAVSRPGAQS